MSPVLLELLLLSIRGRLVRWFRLLRQPKYLIGFVIGVGYVGFFLLRSRISDEGPFFAGRSSVLAGDFAELLHVVLAMALAGFVSGTWLLPWGRLGLPLREAELMLLLPAPLTRRQIIRFALLKGQAGIVISALIISLFAGSGRAAEQTRVIIGLWLVLTLLDLNKKGRALFLLRQREIEPRAAALRRLALIAVIVTFWIAVVVSVRRTVLPVIRAILNGQAEVWDLATALQEGIGAGVSGILLAPFVGLTAMPIASSWTAFAVSFLPSLVLLVLGYEAVVRSRASFEEAALQHARSLATKKSPSRRFSKLSERARHRSPFPLASSGRPEVAVVWKNMMSTSRLPLAHVVSWTAVGLLAVALTPAILNAHPVVLGIAGVFGWIAALFLPLITSMSLRNDFRTDLVHLDLIRAWPISASRLAAAEIVGTALSATAVGCFGAALLLASLIGIHLQAALHGTTSTSIVLIPAGSRILDLPALGAVALIIVGFVPLLAGACALISAVKNLAILAFPAWIGIGPDAGSGFSVLGQRLLVGSGMILALALALIPGAVVVGLALLAQWGLGVPWSAWAFPLWGLLGSVPVFVEFGFLVNGAGRLWSRLDPSTEILELGS